MSKELIEQARAWQTPSAPIIKALADRIEELEREVERKMSAADFILKERDALQANNARLREVLDEAATSLETIQLRSYGDESYLNHMDQVRGFAGSRSRVAKEALAATPEQSLAAYRNKVIEECASVCDKRSMRKNDGNWTDFEWDSICGTNELAADEIRAMTEQP